jgi:hypothetical protein
VSGKKKQETQEAKAATQGRVDEASARPSAPSQDANGASDRAKARESSPAPAQSGERSRARTHASDEVVGAETRRRGARKRSSSASARASSRRTSAGPIRLDVPAPRPSRAGTWPSRSARSKRASTDSSAARAGPAQDAPTISNPRGLDQSGAPSPPPVPTEDSRRAPILREANRGRQGRRNRARRGRRFRSRSSVRGAPAARSPRFFAEGATFARRSTAIENVPGEGSLACSFRITRERCRLDGLMLRTALRPEAIRARRELRWLARRFSFSICRSP